MSIQGIRHAVFAAGGGQFVLLAAILAFPCGGAEREARPILDAAVKRQGGGDLAARGAVKDFYVKLDPLEHRAPDGTLAEGVVRRWYRAPEGPEGKPFVKTWWKDAAGVTVSALGPVSEKAGARRVMWTRKGEAKAAVGTDPPTYRAREREIEEMETLFHAFLLRNLMGPEARFEVEGDEPVDERICVRIRRTVEGDPVVRLWIDAETSELLQVRLSPEAAPDGEEGPPPERTYRFRKHREVKGLRVPKWILIYERTAEQVEANAPLESWRTRAYVSEIEINQGLRPADFALPR